MASVNEFIAQHPSFSTREFADMFENSSQTSGRSTVFNTLKQLIESGEITRISKGHFIACRKKNYSYNLSDTAKEISSSIREKYPLVDFQIWELYQMNEFVNHQIARNTIFVEVEKPLDESLFGFLFDRYTHVLLNPNTDEYYKYSGVLTIVVKRLISESPHCYGEYRQSSLEKLLVDLFARGLSGEIISRSEYHTIYEDSFMKYNINQVRMFRYARRRGVEQTIRSFMQESIR